MSDFWSRRRAAVQAEEADERKEQEAAELRAQTEALEQKSDAEILEELGLPDPETLEAGDDITGFMAKAVPERLRRMALRRLWRLNPVLANVDGLVDYGEDYTDAACVLENLQTTYQVGKGMLAHVEELARQAEAKAEGETPQEDGFDEVPDGTENEPTEPVVAELEPDSSAQDTTNVQVAEIPLTDDTETDLSAPAPRRMRFDFE